MKMPPESSVPLSTGLVGLLGLSFALAFILIFELPLLFGVLFFLLGCGLPMYWLDARRIGYVVLAIRPSKARRRLRLQGLLAVALCFLLNLWLLQVFAPSWIISFYDLLPLLVPLILLWCIWIYWRAVPEWRPDSIELLVFALHRLRQRKPLKQVHLSVLLGWLVKAFFLPLMLAGCVVFLSQSTSEFAWPAGFLGWFAVLWALCYAIDTAFGVLGYCCTSRRLGAQIRSVDQTWLGWVSALICYPPFFIVLSAVIFYKDDYVWSTWLQDTWWLPWWGGLILLLTFIYALATVAFGLRFSNLTYRGLITTGPYRYSKHPAYICKNLSWWLIAVPFIPAFGWQVALAQCASLLVINFIYFLRAKTEERHLMHYSEYREYAAYIAEYGLLARLRKACGLRSGVLDKR